METKIIPTIKSPFFLTSPRSFLTENKSPFFIASRNPYQKTYNGKSFNFELEIQQIIENIINKLPLPFLLHSSPNKLSVPD